MSLRNMEVQYIGDTLYLPPLERKVKHIEVREPSVNGYKYFEPERTCEVDGAYSSDGWLDESSHIWTFELSCGHSIDSLWGEPPRFCPECGAKVVS